MRKSFRTRRRHIVADSVLADVQVGQMPYRHSRFQNFSYRPIGQFGRLEPQRPQAAMILYNLHFLDDVQLANKKNIQIYVELLAM